MSIRIEAWSFRFLNNHRAESSLYFLITPPSFFISVVIQKRRLNSIYKLSKAFSKENVDHIVFGKISVLVKQIFHQCFHRTFFFQSLRFYFWRYYSAVFHYIRYFYLVCNRDNMIIFLFDYALLIKKKKFCFYCIL